MAFRKLANILASVSGILSPVYPKTTTSAVDVLDSEGNVTGTLDDVLVKKAPLDSPQFTGDVIVPDQTAGNNSTKAANTKYVDAKVAESITDGVTGIAPSQNAVFGALALKANAGDVADALALKADADAVINALESSVDKNIPIFDGIAGDKLKDSGVKLSDKADTSAVTAGLALKAPLNSPTFTGDVIVPDQTAGNNSTKAANTKYADAKVADAINNGVTGIAPSQNAVFGALALKANAGDVTASLALKADLTYVEYLMMEGIAL